MSEMEPNFIDQMLDHLSARQKSFFLLLILALNSCAPATDQVRSGETTQLVATAAVESNVPEAAASDQVVEGSKASSAVELESVSRGVYRFVAHKYYNLFQSEIFNQLEEKLGISGVYIAVIDDSSMVWQVFRECYVCVGTEKFFIYPEDSVLVFESRQAAIDYMQAKGLAYHVVYE